MPNELTISNHNYSVAELEQLAQAFVDCHFYGFKDKSEALVLMLKARADNIDPMTAADQYSIIQGRPSLKSEAILIRFQANGGKIKWKQRTDESVTLWLSHPQGGEMEVTWNKERATKAGLWNKDNFKKHPTQMLAARCISEGVRALYPACLGGCYVPEEVEFFDDKSKPEQVQAEPVEETPKAEPVQEQAVEAEVVEASSLDPETVKFKDAMNSLRNVNKEVFDNAWAKFAQAYNGRFEDVPNDGSRQTIYTTIKRAINKATVTDINQYV